MVSEDTMMPPDGVTVGVVGGVGVDVGFGVGACTETELCGVVVGVWVGVADTVIVV